MKNSGKGATLRHKDTVLTKKKMQRKLWKQACVCIWKSIHTLQCGNQLSPWARPPGLQKNPPPPTPEELLSLWGLTFL